MSDQSVPFHQTMRIKRLKHHTEYFLTIAAINCRGQGEESKRIFFKTKRISKFVPYEVRILFTKCWRLIVRVQLSPIRSTRRATLANALTIK